MRVDILREDYFLYSSANLQHIVLMLQDFSLVILLKSLALRRFSTDVTKFCFLHIYLNWAYYSIWVQTLRPFVFNVHALTRFIFLLNLAKHRKIFIQVVMINSIWNVVGIIFADIWVATFEDTWLGHYGTRWCLLFPLFVFLQRFLISLEIAFHLLTMATFTLATLTIATLRLFRRAFGLARFLPLEVSLQLFHFYLVYFLKDFP